MILLIFLEWWYTSVELIIRFNRSFSLRMVIFSNETISYLVILKEMFKKEISIGWTKIETNHNIYKQDDAGWEYVSCSICRLKY